MRAGRCNDTTFLWSRFGKKQTSCLWAVDPFQNLNKSNCASTWIVKEHDINKE